MIATNNLRFLRKTLGLSMQELAIAAGVSMATLVAIERYSYKPGPKVRAKLLGVLGVTEATLWPTLEPATSTK